MRLHRELDDAGALLGGEHLVLAEGAVGCDAVSAVVGQVTDVLLEPVVVDGQVGRQGAGWRRRRFRAMGVVVMSSSTFGEWVRPDVSGG